ncbi:MAG TPA: EamA family transporter [Anaerolineales bacterium]
MKLKIWIALLALYIVWGSTYLAILFAVETIPPFLHAAMRFLISGLILFIWRRAAGDPVPTRRQWISTAIVGVLLLVGGNGFVAFAEQRIPSGVAALIVGTVPLWLVLIEALRRGGTRPNWQSIAGLLIGFGGIFLLIGPSEIVGSSIHFDPVGIAAVVAAAFFWSLGSIFSRSADLPPSTLMATGTEMLAGSVALFILSGSIGEWRGFDPAQISTSSWLGLAYLITFGSLIGFVSYGWLLKNAPVSLVATYAYVNPLVAIMLGAWVAHEALNARILVAALIIIGSVVLTNTSRQSNAGKKEEVKPSPAPAD